MALVHGRDLKQDVLFRASEPVDGSSGWDSKAIDYLNRVYRTLAMGASEYLPQFVEDWWWMRERGVLILKPVFNAGTATVVQGSENIVLSDPPLYSLEGYRFKLDGHQDIFTVATHVAGATDVALDSEFTGDSTDNTFRMMKVTYNLAEDATAVLSPMFGFRETDQIIGMTPERLDRLYPPSTLGSGSPVAFALENTSRVRFSHAGRTDGQSMRIEYIYKPAVVLIEDTTDSIPLVPLEYRQVLADMALVLVLVDKNDDRAASVITLAKSTLTAMYNKNRHEMAKMDSSLGMIFPRVTERENLTRGPLRTESGLFIG